MTTSKTLKVEAGEKPTRLDVWLNGNLPELSRSRIQSLILSGNILVNNKTTRAHQKIAEGMEINVNIPAPEPTELIAEDIPLDILYEDSDIIVLNKQAGLVVHPAAGHPSGTLVNALLYHCTDLAGIGGELRPGIVHRLDKDTSGAMVVAKNEKAMESMVEMFKTGKIEKKYKAIVRGVPKPASGRIETLIGRSRNDRKKMSTQTAKGRNSITEYELVEDFSEFSLVSLTIKTGRTHQIRVHMTHIGNSVVGDQLYGRQNNTLSAKRQMLHSELLAFEHPGSGKRMEFQAPLPEDMERILTLLRNT